MKPPITLAGTIVLAICVVVSTGLLPGCHSNSSFVWVQDLPPAAQRMALEPLRPGDRVFVVVRGQDAMTGEFEVRPGGEVVLPSVGPVPASGSTQEQLAVLIRDRMKGLLTDPQVSVVLSLRKGLISVIGEVKTPGQFELVPHENVLQALSRAGGLGVFASKDEIFVPTNTISVFRSCQRRRAEQSI